MSSAIVECRPREASAAHRTVVIAVLCLITAVGAALRFVNLGLRGLSLEESITVAIARLGWTDMRTVLTSPNANATLYHVLLHYWARLGTSEYFVRSLSALFGTATVVLLYLLGRRLFGTRTGLAAAALLAVNGYHVRYSQEAQSYSLVVLLAVLSSLLFSSAIEGGSNRTWNWYSAASILSGYVHPLGVLVTLAQFGSLRFAENWKDRAKEIRQSGLSIAVGWLPLIWFLAFKSKGQSAQSSIQSISEWFVKSAGRGNHLLLALCALAAVVAIAGALLAGRRFSRGLRFSLALLTLWLLLPSGLMPVVFRKPGFSPGNLILILPALVLLLSAALDWIRSRAVWGLALAVILAISLSGVRDAYSAGFEPKREYMREVTRYILNNSRPGDGAVFYAPDGRIAFEYYREMHSASVIRPRVFFPLRGDGLLMASASAQDPALLASDTLLMVELARRQRVWFVRTGEQDDKCETLQRWLDERFPHMERHGFGPTRFFLYSR